MIRFKHYFNAILSLTSAGILLFSVSVQASPTPSLEEAFAKCKNKYPSDFEAKKRLACFDSIEALIPIAPKVGVVVTSEMAETPHSELKLTASSALATSLPTNSTLPEGAIQTPIEEIPTKVIAVANPRPESSFLERKWRLTSEGDWNISDFETYKTNYLIVTESSNPNNVPVSPTHLSSPDRNLQKEDIKFQISLKSELASNIPLIRDLPFVTSSRLWAAYTQQSQWQFFNKKDSRPFRENNYEPELMLSLGIDNKIDGEKKSYIPRMLNLGIVHQSNGRADPVSRSWNRIYMQGGWELTNNLTLLVRPTWRIPDDNGIDDNPDIVKYMGYGDASLRWENRANKLAATILLRNNFRSENKGFAQLDLQKQVSSDRNINLHLSASTGYGESLLDYNHSQNVIGFGVSLGD